MMHGRKNINLLLESVTFLKQLLKPVSF